MHTITRWRPTGWLAVMFIAAFMTDASLAQGTFAIDSDAPIDMRADIIELDGRKPRADLHGHAQMMQGPLTIAAQKIEVTFAPPPKRQATHIIAIGAVRVHSRNGRAAKADHATYDLASQQIILRGQVTATQTSADGRQQKASGARMVIDMKTGKSQLTGDKTPQRARIKLAP